MTHEPKITGTCQCCGRVIHCKSGVIAHHGYQRPRHWGAQTASCMGARFRPFEESRKRLGQLIELLETELKQKVTRANEIEQNGPDLSITVAIEQRYAGMRAAPKLITITAANFDQLREENKAYFRMQSIHKFDVLRAHWINRLRNDAQQINAELLAQRLRYDSWMAHLRFRGAAYR